MPGHLAAELAGGVTLDLEWIEAGTFVMGSLASDVEAHSSEMPAHEVELTKGFYLGRFAVTQSRWTSVMVDDNPSGHRGPMLPVENITWHEAPSFTARLNQLTIANLPVSIRQDLRRDAAVLPGEACTTTMRGLCVRPLAAAAIQAPDAAASACEWQGMADPDLDRCPTSHPRR